MFVTLTCTRFERSLSPVLYVLHEWLDSWSGIGVIERGMARQGYDLQLTRYANEGWRATFFLTGREHSMTGVTGSALGFAAGAAGVVFYIVESFYLRREEKRDKRQSRPKDI
jgi:hypothetical protein